MSVRLNIVLSQSATGAAAHRDLEGELAIRLMGAAGMDLSLIGPLDRMGDDSTDRLALDGITGDAAILCWCSADDAEALVAAAGVAGRRAPHASDPHAAPPPPGTSERRLFLFDIRGRSVDQLVLSLDRLLASRRTVTYSLSAPSQPPEADIRPAPMHPVGIRPAASGTTAFATGISSEHSRDAGDPGAVQDADDREGSRTGYDPWETLVDDLNASDI